MATKLAGEVEGREKHDTSCLKGNRTTAPEGAEGLFSIHYPGPVKQTSEKGARDCPSEPRKMHKAQRMGHQFGALSTEKLFFFHPWKHTHAPIRLQFCIVSQNDSFLRFRKGRGEYRGGKGKLMFSAWKDQRSDEQFFSTHTISSRLPRLYKRMRRPYI